MLRSESEIEKSVVEWLRAELDDSEITADDNFLDIGGHSLTFARLNAFLADAHGAALDMKTAYDHSLATAVAASTPAPSQAS
ncbi:acyl carrier protein [Streptomyces sp. NBC_00882]|uniref:acyl carrier protein n=1 Tax=Streptomyces sp. NBC_00882 TaxID=2975856 RepID=UPI00386F95CE|nr:acyl carrier protein [Streptomyces sp. NBC_00882]